MVLIDLALAGDNAVVIALAAAGIPPVRRARVIVWGLTAAVLLRVALSLVAVHLLTLVGLTLAGGLLLLWVCWKLYRDIKTASPDPDPTDESSRQAPGPSFRAAIGRIVLADISMSLDNVLAIAGAAREHPLALTVGLLLSAALMGVAASLIIPILKRHPWLAWLGLAMVLYVALDMIFEGSAEVLGVLE